MFEVYRVRRPFHWRGWHYGPRHTTNSINPDTGEMESCNCQYYGGDIWFVEAGHPRKDAMMFQRFIVGDASLPSAEELLKEERFKRLTMEPSESQPELVMAGRGPGRPRFK